MKINKKIQTTLLILLGLSILAFIAYLWMLNRMGKAYESIGESLQVPSEVLKEVPIGKTRYLLLYSPGAAFTSREWAVVANRGDDKRLVIRISAQDGQIKDIHQAGDKIGVVYSKDGKSFDRTFEFPPK